MYQVLITVGLQQTKLYTHTRWNPTDNYRLYPLPLDPNLYPIPLESNRQKYLPGTRYCWNPTEIQRRYPLFVHQVEPYNFSRIRSFRQMYRIVESKERSVRTYHRCDSFFSAIVNNSFLGDNRKGAKFVQGTLYFRKSLSRPDLSEKHLIRFLFGIIGNLPSRSGKYRALKNGRAPALTQPS